MVGRRLAREALSGCSSAGVRTGEIVPKAAITVSQATDLSGDRCRDVCDDGDSGRACRSRPAQSIHEKCSAYRDDSVGIEMCKATSLTSTATSMAETKKG